LGHAEGQAEGNAGVDVGREEPPGPAAAPDALEDGVSERAKIVLLCAEGLANRDVARRSGTWAHTVGRWRVQFLAAGVRGLQDAPHRGGRRPISDEQIDEVVAIALETCPAGLP
jgi:hypothetical protein